MILSNAKGLIGRDEPLFAEDVSACEEELSGIISKSSFLVIGAAGSIGQAVTKEIFKRDPSKLHVVDVSENNMVELVRDIRSTLGYIKGDFRTFAVDCGACEFEGPPGTGLFVVVVAFSDQDRNRNRRRRR